MRQRQPLPREGVYEFYWRFAYERQKAFERRVAGCEPPWTSDPIISEFKFCNVFRAADRVSQYLISEVCYHCEPCSTADRLFQIVAFRLFSKIDTWDTVREYLGRQPTLEDLSTDRFTKALAAALSRNGRIYTGAFILCANDSYGKPYKYLNHIELLRHMFLMDDLAFKIRECCTLEELYWTLHQYPLIGDFMAYQIAIDLNYSELVNFDEDDFTQPGPGALRGIKKCFVDAGGLQPSEIIMWMVDHQEEEFAKLGLEFSGLWGRRLHAIDCQGLFCETDKYCRVAAPQLESARKRIKAKFLPQSDAIAFFFPPKWGLNESISAQNAVQKPLDVSASVC
ncbi:nucleotide kinase domain-containing protein [Mycolicibacterium vinylchloridicum]|uniref:nucleotide kinase domain-containing protein n=1 Tax=Mycolicibacterium vinylchloridicum TaxID=2736928 RepID=UPI0015CC1B5F|nr:nucleotide kinase domain-containing protein [Mycolicibacterium vinylchloridicum]